MAASSEERDWTWTDSPLVCSNPLFRAAYEKIKAVTQETDGRPCGNIFHRADATTTKFFSLKKIFLAKEGVDKQILQDEFREGMLITQLFCEGIVRLRDPDALVILNFDFIFTFVRSHERSMVVNLHKIKELKSEGSLAYISAEYRKFALMVNELYSSRQPDSGHVPTRTLRKELPSNDPDSVLVVYRDGFLVGPEGLDLSDNFKMVHPDGREEVIPLERVILITKEKFYALTNQAAQKRA